MEKLTQLTVLLENRPGALAEVASVLSEAKVAIRAISVDAGVHHGLLNLVTTQAETARRALYRAHIRCSEREIFALTFRDWSRALASACALLAEQKINIELAYGSAGGLDDEASGGTLMIGLADAGGERLARLLEQSPAKADPPEKTEKP
jgi:hypothetical protein